MRAELGLVLNIINIAHVSSTSSDSFASRYILDTTRHRSVKDEIGRAWTGERERLPYAPFGMYSIEHRPVLSVKPP